MDLITCSKNDRLFFSNRSWNVGALYAAIVEFTTENKAAILIRVTITRCRRGYVHLSSKNSFKLLPCLMIFGNGTRGRNDGTPSLRTTHTLFSERELVRCTTLLTRVRLRAWYAPTLRPIRVFEYNVPVINLVLIVVKGSVTRAQFDTCRVRCHQRFAAWWIRTCYRPRAWPRCRTARDYLNWVEIFVEQFLRKLRQVHWVTRTRHLRWSQICWWVQSTQCSCYFARWSRRGEHWSTRVRGLRARTWASVVFSGLLGLADLLWIAFNGNDDKYFCEQQKDSS